MKYLVTGGAGFIGSHLVDLLAARGDSVVVLDDLSTGRRENIGHLEDSPLVELVEGSILDGDLVDECMQPVDACLHLASAVGVKLIVQRPLDTLLTNIRGNDVVISSAARWRKRLLFTSTSEIYGKCSSGSLHEDADRVVGSPFKTRWAYATAKAFGEALAHSYVIERGCEMVVVRLFNTVGPRQSDAYGMVLPRFARQALNGQDLTVYGNGEQSRCFVHVLDSVRAIAQLMDADGVGGRVFNIGSRAAVTIFELARRVIQTARSNSRIVLVPYEEAYGEGFEELGWRVPDTSALEEATGWQATRTLDETIADVVAYEREAKPEGAHADEDFLRDISVPSDRYSRIQAGSGA